MANPWAGEVAIGLNGKRQVMKLTLGALAELESELGADSLVALIQRFEDGKVSSRDVLALLCAGLRGGGWRGAQDDLTSAEIEGGVMAAVAACGRLLAVSFAQPEVK